MPITKRISIIILSGIAAITITSLLHGGSLMAGLLAFAISFSAQMLVMKHG